MMTRTGRRGIPVLIAALAVLALAVGVFTTHVQPAHAQDATITSLLSRLDAGFFDFPHRGATTIRLWDTTRWPTLYIGSLSPAWFNYPAGFSPSYTVEGLYRLPRRANTGDIVADRPSS